jgi:hypothetical protein
MNNTCSSVIPRWPRRSLLTLGRHGPCCGGLRGTHAITGDPLAVNDSDRCDSSRLAGASVKSLLVMLALAALVAGCVTTDFQPTPPATNCALPWESMDQVFDCAAADYELASMEGEQTANIIVASKEAGVIAAAMAHAWNEHIPFDEEAVVWAWSDPERIGLGYDRGVLLEQGELGNLLVFQVCTAWEAGILGENCTDRMEFTIDQEAD